MGYMEYMGYVLWGTVVVHVYGIYGIYGICIMGYGSPYVWDGAKTKWWNRDVHIHNGTEIINIIKLAISAILHI